ncbi:hypothetical protein [uncultured Megasphaera sp.]|uniref:hypothetical protein n=1 Tax=uncultured Megasphaera sp. TaxID=165188 RepID=UPI00259746AC|nr:hypothetical protein [uncultured Megasphaera sp.]
MKKQLLTGALVLSLLTCGGLTTTTQAFNFGSLLKLGGVSFLVDRYSSQINTVLNKLMIKNGAGTNYATKVVPVLSVGTGNYIGAVQVIGPQRQVEKVKAVGQLDASINGIARANAYIPLATTNVMSLHRVDGVGVSAVVDLKL